MIKIIIKLIFLLKLQEKREFIRKLSKLEYGVSAFCLKLSKQCEKDAVNMSAMLVKHSQDERRHGKMLSSYVDGNDRLKLHDVGSFLSIEIKDNPPESFIKTATAKTVFWDSVKYPGKFYVGLFENYDGISDRYLSAKMLFGFKKASDYDWVDKIAFMKVLEEKTGEFYKEFSLQVKDKVLKSIIEKILEDENNHNCYLNSLAKEFNSDLEKWRFRIWFASFFLIWDIANEYIR